MEYYLQTALWHLGSFFTGPFGWIPVALIALVIARNALTKLRKRQ